MSTNSALRVKESGAGPVHPGSRRDAGKSVCGEEIRGVILQRMRYTRAIFPLIVLLWVLVASTHAAVFTGKIRNSAKHDNFVYLGKFCFDYTVGELYNAPGGAVDVEITPIDPEQPVELNDVQLWMFDDEASSWPALQFRDLSCQERFKKARGAFLITPDEDLLETHKIWKYNRTFDISQHLRPRHWWFVLASCKGEFKNIKWKVHAYNLHVSPTLKEFGVDERYIPIIYRCSLLLFAVLLVTHVYGMRRYFARAQPIVTYTSSSSSNSIPSSRGRPAAASQVDDEQDDGASETLAVTNSDRDPQPEGPAPTFLNYTPQIIQLFTISLSLTAFCHWAHFMHTHFYAVDGQGVWWVDRVAGVIDVVAKVQLTMVIMLISSGWAAGHNQTEHSRRTVLILLGVFGFIYLCMAVFKAVLQDSQYTRIPRLITIWLDLITVAWTILAAWFLRTIIKAYNHETSRVVIAETLFPNSDTSRVMLNPGSKSDPAPETSLASLPFHAEQVIDAEQRRRRRLYLTLATLYTFWLICEPLMVFLQNYLKPWVRAEIVTAVSTVTSLIAYGWFVWAFWPSHDGEYMMLYSSLRVPNANKALLKDDDGL